MTDEFRLVQTDELDAMYDLRARAFEQGTASEWAAFAEQDPWRDAGSDLVAVSDGRIVASLQVLDRRISGCEGDLRLAGIGAVSSDPDVRRRGNVRRLLALAHEHNRSAGYDMAMLFTGSSWVYSGSAGFTALPFWALDLDVRRLTVRASAWTIEPADPRRHLPEMQRVYEAFGEGRLGYPLRGHAYWSHPTRLTDTTLARVALDPSGSVAAYVRVRVMSDGRARVQECPFVAADAVYALAADLALAPALAQCATVTGRLPRDHPLGAIGHLQTYAGAMACSYTTAGAQLLEALHDPANQRSVYWSGDNF